MRAVPPVNNSECGRVPLSRFTWRAIAALFVYLGRGRAEKKRARKLSGFTFARHDSPGGRSSRACIIHESASALFTYESERANQPCCPIEASLRRIPRRDNKRIFGLRTRPFIDRGASNERPASFVFAAPLSRSRDVTASERHVFAGLNHAKPLRVRSFAF